MHHESRYIDVCKIIINNVVNNGSFTYFLFTSIDSPLTTNIAFAHFLLDNAFKITFFFPFTYCMQKFYPLTLPPTQGGLNGQISQTLIVCLNFKIHAQNMNGTIYLKHVQWSIVFIPSRVILFYMT